MVLHIKLEVCCIDEQCFHSVLGVMGNLELGWKNFHNILSFEKCNSIMRTLC